MLSLIITIIVIGVLLWAVNKYIPMDQKIKDIMNIVVVICVVVFVLNAFGLFGRMGNVPVPQVR